MLTPSEQSAAELRTLAYGFRLRAAKVADELSLILLELANELEAQALKLDPSQRR